MKLMRKLIAPIIVTLVGIALVVTGTLYLTAWRPSGIIEATTPKKIEGNFVISRPGVLELNAQTAHISVKGKGDVFIAIGRSTDVTGWVGGIEHSEIVGLESDEVLAVEKRDGQKIDAPVEPAPTEEGEEGEENADDKTKDDPQGLTAEELEVVKAPQSADTWQVVKTGKGKATIDWPQKYGYWSLMAYSADSTPQVSIMWKTPVSLSWVTPLILTGALLILAGLIWIILVVIFARKKRKQQGEALPGKDAKETPGEADATGAQPEPLYAPQDNDLSGVTISEDAGVLAEDVSENIDVPASTIIPDGEAVDGVVPGLSGMAEPEIPIEEPLSDKERKRAEKKAARAARKAERAQRKAQKKAEKLAAKEQARLAETEQQPDQMLHGDGTVAGDESMATDAPAHAPVDDSASQYDSQAPAQAASGSFLDATSQDTEGSREAVADVFDVQEFSGDTAVAASSYETSYDTPYDTAQSDTFTSQDFAGDLPSAHDSVQSVTGQIDDVAPLAETPGTQSLAPAPHAQELPVSGEFSLPLTSQDFAAGKVPSRRELREARRRGEAVLKVGDKEFPTGYIPVVQPPAEPVAEPDFDTSADFPQRQPYVKDGSAPIPAATSSFNNTERPDDAYLDPKLFGTDDLHTGSDVSGYSGADGAGFTPMSEGDTVPTFDSQSYSGAVAGSYMGNYAESTTQVQPENPVEYQSLTTDQEDYSQLFGTGVDTQGSFNDTYAAPASDPLTASGDHQWTGYPATDSTAVATYGQPAAYDSGSDYSGGTPTYEVPVDNISYDSPGYYSDRDPNAAPSGNVSDSVQGFASYAQDYTGDVPVAPFGTTVAGQDGYVPPATTGAATDSFTAEAHSTDTQSYPQAMPAPSPDSSDALDEDDRFSIDDFQGDSAFTKGQRKNTEGTF